MTVEFILVAVLKWTSNEHLCTATMHRVYQGQGPMADRLSVELELVDFSDALEGPDCSGVNVPVIQTQTLEGTFAPDGTFTGNIRNAWTVTATRAD